MFSVGKLENSSNEISYNAGKRKPLKRSVNRQIAQNMPM